MRKTKKTVKKAAKTKPSRRPKPRGYSIEMPRDLVEQLDGPRPWPTSPSRPRPILESAHGIAEPTPCATCGGPCDRDEARYGPWRRHQDCEQITQPWHRVSAAAVFLGVGCSDAEARTAVLGVPPFSAIHDHATTYDEKDVDRRSPWAHVRRRDLVRAVLRARQVLAETAGPTTCTTGRCVWCGAEESTSWHADGHRWADGTPGPLCHDCHPVFRRRGKSAQWWDDQRAGVAEALTGAPLAIKEEAPPMLKAYAEVDPKTGTGEAWSHLPSAAVDAYRWSLWARYGAKYAPPEHKAEALARQAAHESARALREAAEASADPFGFAQAESDGESRE